MDNISFEGFKAFVFAQDPGREVNHDGWHTCSVGEYLADADPEAFADSSNMDHVYKLMGAVDVIFHEHYTLRLVLGSANSANMPTYGDVRAAIIGTKETNDG